MRKTTVGEMCELAKEDSWIRFEGECLDGIPSIRVGDIVNGSASAVGMIAQGILREWCIDSWRLETEKVDGKDTPVLVLEI